MWFLFHYFMHHSARTWRPVLQMSWTFIHVFASTLRMHLQSNFLSSSELKHVYSQFTYIHTIENGSMKVMMIRCSSSLLNIYLINIEWTSKLDSSTFVLLYIWSLKLHWTLLYYMYTILPIWCCAVLVHVLEVSVLFIVWIKNCDSST